MTRVRRAWRPRVREVMRAILLALLLPGAARAEEITVHAAASMADALQDVNAGFTRAARHTVVLNLGASNALARQIRAGAPADVFLSADAAQVATLVGTGHVLSQARVDLLSNRLVVVEPRTAPPRIRAAADLAAVKRLALADPEAVPAGVYARTWLQSRGLWTTLQDRVVPALDVRAALTAVESGLVDAGIVFATDAQRSSRVRVAFEVPRAEGPPILYVAAPLARSAHPAVAAAYLRHLQSAEAQGVFARHGFLPLFAR